MQTIIITLEGGIIQNIENIPEGVTVEVLDFDVEGADPTRHKIEKTERGEEYIKTIWGGGP